MKKIIIFISFLLIQLSSMACEICGCGVGNFYVGLMPNFNKKFIGVRYQYLKYHSTMKNDNTQFSTDYFKTTELWGGVNIGKKLQLLAFVPYNFNKQFSDDSSFSSNGFGDISVLANYKIFASKNADNKKPNHSIMIGVGVKFASGKFNKEIVKDSSVSLMDVNTQLGSGSNDFLLNVMHNVKWKSYGINTTATYKINTENSNNYKYGNKLILNSNFYYNVVLSNITITPNIGLLYENTNNSSFNKTIIEHSESNVFLGLVGVQTQIKNLIVGANVFIPVAQNFSQNQTELRSRGAVHVSFVF